MIDAFTSQMLLWFRVWYHSPTFHSLWHWTAETAFLDRHNMSNARAVPKDELRDRLWHSSAPGTNTPCYNPVCRGRTGTVLCAISSERSGSRAMPVSLIHLSSLRTGSPRHVFSTVVSVLGRPNCYLSSTFVVQLVKALRTYPHLFPKYYTFSRQVKKKLAMNFNRSDTLHMQKSIHTVYFIILQCFKHASHF